MDFDEDTVIQDVITKFDQIEINDPNEEIWYQGENPEVFSIDDHQNQIHLEENYKREVQEIFLKDRFRPKLKLNPEFEATVYSYFSQQNLPLHDHERKDLTQLEYRFNQNCYVYRYKTEKEMFVDFLTHEEVKMGKLPHQSAELLFEIKLENSLIDKSKNFYMIQPQNIARWDEIHQNTRLDKRIYKIIQSKTKNSDLSSFHKLKKNDEIRFGLETFKVIEIDLSSAEHRIQEREEARKFFMVENGDFQNSKDKKIEQIACKICLNSQNTFDDPLINPCFCKGSCKYVHFSCLKTWLDSYLQKQTDPFVDSYKWSKFECEICKTRYPLQICENGKVLQLAAFERPTLPYVAFEWSRYGCKKHILVVKGQQFPIHIGRNADCDIRIVSNTASRIHAVIEFKEGEFYLQDMDSKYGTLVRINRGLKVEGKLKIQVGDLLIRFDLVVRKQGKQYVWKYE